MFTPDVQCPFCGTQDAIEVLSNDTWIIQATSHSPAMEATGITCFHCTQCDEKYVSGEMDRLNQPKLVEARRKAEHLLSSEQIKELLKKVPYSDKEIEAALGLGATSLTRWKAAKAIQSPSKDALLIAIGEDPTLLEVIAERRGIKLTGRKKGRPAKEA